MSYDVSFKAKLDGVNQYVNVGDEQNYTWNMNKAMAVASGSNAEISKFDEKSTTEVLPIVEKIIYEFVHNPEQYRQYEPSNGWGSIETCLKFLRFIQKNCIEYPTAIVVVNC